MNKSSNVIKNSNNFFATPTGTGYKIHHNRIDTEMILNQINDDVNNYIEKTSRRAKDNDNKNRFTNFDGNDAFQTKIETNQSKRQQAKKISGKLTKSFDNFVINKHIKKSPTGEQNNQYTLYNKILSSNRAKDLKDKIISIKYTKKHKMSPSVDMTYMYTQSASDLKGASTFSNALNNRGHKNSMSISNYKITSKSIVNTGTSNMFGEGVITAFNIEPNNSSLQTKRDEMKYKTQKENDSIQQISLIITNKNSESSSNVDSKVVEQTTQKRLVINENPNVRQINSFPFPMAVQTEGKQICANERHNSGHIPFTIEKHDQMITKIAIKSLKPAKTIPRSDYKHDKLSEKEDTQRNKTRRENLNTKYPREQPIKKFQIKDDQANAQGNNSSSSSTPRSLIDKLLRALKVNTSPKMNKIDNTFKPKHFEEKSNSEYNSLNKTKQEDNIRNKKISGHKFQNIINNNLSFFQNNIVQVSQLDNNKQTIDQFFKPEETETERSERNKEIIIFNKNTGKNTHFNLNNNIDMAKTRKINLAMRPPIHYISRLEHKKPSPPQETQRMHYEPNHMVNKNIHDNKTLFSSEDECVFSGDEKTKITNVPVFQIKKLENYNFASNSNKADIRLSNNKIMNKFILQELFVTVLSYKTEIKENILNYLSFKDIINLSLTNKTIRKETRAKVYSIVMNLILNENNQILRIKIWKSIYKYSQLSQSRYLRKIYLDNLFTKSKYDEDIKKDLLRTCPDDPTFKAGKMNNRKLFNLLNAYSNYNTNIGYAQGLNFIVATSLMFFKDEEEIFIFIDSFVNKLNLEGILGIHNNLLINRLIEVGELLKVYVPGLIDFLDDNGLDHQFFTTNWIITIFSNTVETQYVFRIWDFVIIYGWSFIYFFIVSVLIQFESVIKKCDTNTLSTNIKRMLRSEIFHKSFKGIVKRTFDLMAKNSL